jgi:hypothetical protein
MLPFIRTFPPLLSELHQLPFDYQGGEGIDFDPYKEFMSADENATWIRAWTGHPELTGLEYRMFGADGSGGLAGFWLVREAELLAQPIVFLGSEGEMGVIAQSFDDYLWLLAGGFGPAEAVEDPSGKRVPNRAFTNFAAQHAPANKKPALEVIATAREEFPGFEDRIRELCR